MLRHCFLHSAIPTGCIIHFCKKDSIKTNYTVKTKSESWNPIMIWNTAIQLPYFSPQGGKKKRKRGKEEKKNITMLPIWLEWTCNLNLSCTFMYSSSPSLHFYFFYSASALIGKKQSWCKHNNSQLQLYILQWYDLFTENRRYQVFGGFFTVLPHMVWERSWCEAGSHKLSVVHEQWTLLLIQEDEVLLQP